MSEAFDGRFWAWFFSGWPRRISAILSREPSRQLLAQLRLQGNETVVDVGSGSGFYSIALAELLPQGRVYAFDLAPTMMAKLDRLAASRGFAGRIESGVADGSAIPLADACADACISVAALHHMSQPRECLGEMCRILRPGGTLAVLEWLAPPDDGATAAGHHGGHHHGPALLSQGELISAVEEAGLEQTTIAHYRKWSMLVFRKPQRHG